MVCCDGNNDPINLLPRRTDHGLPEPWRRAVAKVAELLFCCRLRGLGTHLLWRAALALGAHADDHTGCGPLVFSLLEMFAPAPVVALERSSHHVTLAQWGDHGCGCVVCSAMRRLAANYVDDGVNIAAFLQSGTDRNSRNCLQRDPVFYDHPIKISWMTSFPRRYDSIFLVSSAKFIICVAIVVFSRRSSLFICTTSGDDFAGQTCLPGTIPHCFPLRSGFPSLGTTTSVSSNGYCKHVCTLPYNQISACGARFGCRLSTCTARCLLCFCKVPNCQIVV